MENCREENIRRETGELQRKLMYIQPKKQFFDLTVLKKFIFK